jgi:D-alanyl-D-alanine carboxypeptidase (penicillin-binding protein 5/6)
MPRPGLDHKALVALRVEAMRRAKSARYRRFAAFFIIAFLVTAASPVYEHVNEKYPQASLSAVFARSKAYIEDIPRGIRSALSGDDAKLLFDSESSAGLVNASGANPVFSSASLRSSAAILANSDTGVVLLKKNADIRIYPASLTKIMTVLMALERRNELPESIVLDPALFMPLYDAGSTMAGFLPGEEVGTVDLIYGALLQSGGECSAALARAIAGSEENFAVMMNARAREFGMFDTHFTNSTGLHDPEHYSTARDMAKLLIFALENEDFEEAFRTARYDVAPSNLRRSSMTLKGNMFARIRTVEFKGGRILGGKTGWTEEAGQCLASLAEKNGNRYIFVSVGNGVEPNGASYNFEDALNVYENAILAR